MSVSIDSPSPSARKPQLVVADWLEQQLPIELTEFAPASDSILTLAHSPTYIKGVMAGAIENGFGSRDITIDELECDVLFYQAGADMHIDDPLGGLMTTEELLERDRTGFEHCSKRSLPCVWNLAGGYVLDADAAGYVEPARFIIEQEIESAIAIKFAHSSGGRLSDSPVDPVLSGIESAMQSPLSAMVDGVQVTSHSLSDLIAADMYLRSEAVHNEVSKLSLAAHGDYPRCNAVLPR